MVTVCYVIAAILMALGIFMIMGLDSSRVAKDMLDLLRPADKLKTLTEDVQAKRKRGGLYGELLRIKNTMETTGKGRLFPLALTSVFGFAAVGVLIALLMDNIWLIPALAIGLGSIPYLYMSSAVEYYERTTRDELETALSIITNAYIRTDDIVLAVRENLDYIKPPLRGVFEKFVQESVVMPSNKEIIIRLRGRLDNAVFYEWCTTLLQCQDDRTLKENLNPVVSKLTDIRLINTQNAAVVASAKTEYFAMVGFMVASVPLMGVLLPGGIGLLTENPIGKFISGVVSAILIFTFFRMRKVTRIVEFDAK